MKIKPVVFYISIFVIVLFAIILLNFDSSEQNTTQMPNDDIHQNINNMPNDEIHKGMGQSSMGKSDVRPEYYKTLDSLKTLYEANPKDSTSSRLYAQYLISGHDKEKALSIYSELTKNFPNSVTIAQEAAYMFFQAKDFDKAEQLIKQAIKVEPKNSTLVYNLGIVYATKGDKILARKTWEQILNEFPNSNEVSLAKKGIEELTDQKEKK